MMVIALDDTRRARGLPPARPDRSVALGAAVFVAGWSEGAWMPPARRACTSLEGSG